MNPIDGRQVVLSIHRRKVLIVGVALAVMAVTLVKEMTAAPSYVAELTMVVSDVRLGRQGRQSVSNTAAMLGDLIPEPFNPKVYEGMLLSPNVLGDALSLLKEDNAFAEGEAPELHQFVGMVRIEADVVAQTTYSPMLRLKATAPSPELATQIVKCWAECGKLAARKANSLRLAAASETLVNQEADRGREFEEVLALKQEEMAQWDISVLEEERALRVLLLGSATEERHAAQRTLASAQGSLEALELQLAGEPERLEVFRAPSDDAYFNATSADGQADSGIERKGMVTEQLNGAHIALKAVIHEMQGSIAGNDASIKILDEQIASAEKERDELTKLIWEHSTIQDLLATDEGIARKIYEDIASIRSLVENASTLTDGVSADNVDAVGLNELSAETHARIDTGALGAKGKMLVAGLIAALLAIAYGLIRDIGQPWLDALRKENGAS